MKDQSEDVQPFVIEDPDSAIPQSLSLKLKEQHPKPQVISSISCECLISELIHSNVLGITPTCIYSPPATISSYTLGGFRELH